MGAAQRINQSYITNSPLVTIPTSFLQNSKSICKIKCKDIFGTGFLIKFKKDDKDFFCLMTCEHVISSELIKQKEKIFFCYCNVTKIKEIVLDTSKRFIKDFKEFDIDAVVIEILNSDKINETYFLMPNDEYMDNLSNLNNKKIEILQFPRGGDLGISEGEIIKIDKNEITHKAGTEEGSSGSPLFLKDEMGVIGIHKQEKSDKLENYANSIRPIFYFFKDRFIYNDMLYDYLKNKYGNIDSNSEDSKNDSLLPQNIDLELYPEFEQINLYDSKILNFHSVNGLIECKTREIGNHKNIRIKDYIRHLEIGNKKCYKCLNSTELFFCSYCKKYICERCRYLHMKHRSYFRRLDKLGNMCTIHDKKLISYCQDCEKNICEECEYKFHKSHQKEEIIKSNVVDAAYLIKKDINIKRSMNEFYEMIKAAYESNPDNNIYKQNVFNVAKSIEKENQRDEFEEDLAIYKIEQLKRNYD